MPTTLKVFISSPGDVGQERLIATRVVERLQGEFGGVVKLVPILWEHEPLRATGHFQEQIINPAETDIVVCILWSRLGTRLPPEKFQRADGTAYDSGTEWEFEEAARAYLEHGRPHLLVYRKTADPLASLGDEDALLERLRQKKALDGFIDRWFGNARDSFRAAFLAFQSAEQFEELLRAHLSRLINDLIPAHPMDGSEATAAITWHKGSPYRGLEAFDVEHAPVFFGRWRAIGEIKEALTRQAAHGRPFLVVFGMSGCGKSSLVRAGVLPTITQPGVIEGVGLWRCCVFRPSDAAEDLFDGLTAALLEPQGLPELEAMGLGAHALAPVLRESPQGAAFLISAGLQRAAEAVAAEERLPRLPEARLLILIDQLEELFTLDRVRTEQREKFIAALATLARGGRVWVIATMRSDFYPRCSEIPDLIALKEGDGQYDLLPPTFAEIGQILREPTRAAGLRFEMDHATGERLEDRLHRAAADNPEALPLLEFTLEELFKRRTPEGVLTMAAYEELGGLEGALAQRAEEALAALDPTIQAALPALLHALVTVEDETGLVASRRVTLESLTASAEALALVDALIGARLLVTDRADDGQAVVGLAHEALLRHWPRIQLWLDDNQEFLLTRRRLEGAAVRWRRERESSDYLLPEGRPLAEAEDLLLRRRVDLDAALAGFIEASRQKWMRVHRRKLQWVVSTVCTLAMLTLLSAAQWSRANVQWHRAVAERQRAEQQKRLTLQTLVQLTNRSPELLADAPDAIRFGTLQMIIDLDRDLLGKVFPDWDTKRLRAVMLDQEGRVQLRRGDSESGRAKLEEAWKLGREIAQHAPNPDDERNLATYCADLADALATQDVVFEPGKPNPFERGLSLYEESLRITQRLARSNAQDRVDLVYRHMRLGDFHALLHRTREALQAYDNGIQLAGSLRQDDSQGHLYLFGCYVGKGDLYAEMGENENARRAYQESVRIVQALLRKRDSARLRKELAEAMRKLSRVKQALNIGANHSSSAPDAGNGSVVILQQ